MSKLEELVPPLELCKLIPKGEFEDSYFAWYAELQHINPKPPHEYSYYVANSNKDFLSWGSYKSCPAPTLEEIITEAGKTFDMVIKRRLGANQSLVTNALKQWLKLKGIEYGK